jgi:predicted aldo/keto reductase-like oxidoreductase
VRAWRAVSGLLGAFLTKYELLDIENLPKEINIPEIQKALNILKEMSFSKKEKDIYNAQLNLLHKGEEDRAHNKNKSKKDFKNKKSSIFETIVSSMKKFLEYFSKIYKK